MPSPFTAPLSTAWRTDPFAWKGGKHRQPTWLKLPGKRAPALDTAGVHALLRAACLPRAELLHMGWLDRELAPDADLWLSEHRVVPLLGHIWHDAVVLNLTGAAWDGSEWRQIRGLGHKIVNEWFHA